MIKCYWNDKEIEFKPFKYPAGEVAYKINGAPSKIVCWFEGSDDILLMSMLQEHFPGAKLYFPYLPFGREDRRVSENASFGLEAFEKIFKYPTAGTYTFDIHSKSRNGNFRNIEPLKIIHNIVEELRPDCYGFPDYGARERYRDCISSGSDYFFAIKRRHLETGEIISYELEPQHLREMQKSKKILIIDDICDGGRTFIELAKLLPDKELYLYVSHGIFSKGFDELKKYYKHIYTTDSYKGARDDEFVTEYRCL